MFFMYLIVSPKSHSCHLHISSPTTVTNNDVTVQERKAESREKYNLGNSDLNHIQVDEIFDCMVELTPVELAAKLNIHMSIQIRD